MDPPDPALVGKAFVKQYYTQMHRDPSQMHRFYLDQSSFVHGGSEIGSEEPVIGQKAINDKILSLDLQQVHAKIKQVDSHATLGNGIVIQVTGELSISGRPMRAFVQTFVLAPESPKKYYVHNDIFRYQDDDLVSESETNDGPGEGENPPIIDQSAEDAEYAHPLSSETSPDVSKDEGVLYVAATTEVGGEVAELENPEGVGGGESAVAWDQYRDPSGLPDLQQNGLSGEDVGAGEGSAPQPPQQEFVMLEPTAHVSEGEGVPETTGDAFHSSEAHEPDSSKATWASRLTRGGGAGGFIAPAMKQPLAPSQSPNQRPVNSTMSGFPVSMPTSQPLPQREPRRRPDTRGDMSRTSAKDASKKGAPIISPKDAPDSHQIFVGGLPGNSNEQDLRMVFGDYGSIIEIRVNPKNFAFVVFDNAESVQKIMNERDRIQLKSKYLNIEPKRPSMPRGAPGSSRGKAISSGGGKPRSSKPPKR